MKKFNYSPEILASMLVATGFLSACNDNSLTPLVPNEVLDAHYVTVDAQFCTSEPAAAKQKIKYLFILDHSGSNKAGFTSPLDPNDVQNTDPDGSRRYGPLVQFVTNMVPDPNNLTSFALIDFNDDAYAPGFAGAYSGGGNPPVQTFDTDPNHFLTAYVEPDWEGCFNNAGAPQSCFGTASAPNPDDQGFTDYLKALTAAGTLIQNDLAAEAASLVTPPVKITYQIIFVSDGYPIINNNGVAQAENFSPGIATTITNIMNLKQLPTYAPLISGIFLNTAFYYPTGLTIPLPAQEENALQLLQQMAYATPGGQAAVFAGGQSIVYQTFAPPVRNVKYNVADVWVENMNAVWWDNGQLMLDSDGDGLPDIIETQLGSNPFVADSDGNGVSDLVEYRTKGAPCNGVNCNPSARDPYSICAGFSPSVDGNGNVTYPATSGDGLNNCEKSVLGGVQNNFDSNGDFIPDFLSFRNSIPFIANTTGAFLDPFADPLNNYNKLKAGLPISISTAKVLNFTARATTLEHVASTTSDNQCYHMIVNNVAALNGGNTIKVSLIQNNAIIDNTPILQTAVRTLDGPSSSIYFVPSDFH
jgi:hypothetical protein